MRSGPRDDADGDVGRSSSRTTVKPWSPVGASRGRGASGSTCPGLHVVEVGGHSDLGEPGRPPARRSGRRPSRAPGPPPRRPARGQRPVGDAARTASHDRRDLGRRCCRCPGRAGRSRRPGTDGALSRRPAGARRAGHVEGVGDDHPVNPSWSRSSPVEHRAAEGRRRVRVELRQQEVRRHHPTRPAAIAAANGTSSRSRSSASDGQRPAGRGASRGGSPCPGKCLAVAPTPVDWTRGSRRRRAARPGLRSPEAADPDHRVVGADVDVDVRGKVRVQPVRRAPIPRRRRPPRSARGRPAGRGPRCPGSGEPSRRRAA